jgi:hypothetical protein
MRKVRQGIQYAPNDSNMVGRLAGHSMFAEPGAIERLKMCADCRGRRSAAKRESRVRAQPQMNVGAPHNTEARICDEDLARAEVYALISTLLYQAPSNELFRCHCQ